MDQGKGLTKEALQVSEKQAVPGGYRGRWALKINSKFAPEKGWLEEDPFHFGMLGPLFFEANC